MIARALPLLAFGLIVACAPAQAPDDEEGGSSEGALTDEESGDSKMPSKSTSSKEQAPAKATTTAKTKVTVDGQRCTIDSAEIETGLTGAGWTLFVRGTCPTRFYLTVGGMGDRPYPQTQESAILQGESVSLITFRGNQPGTDECTSRETGGSHEITAGPAKRGAATVRGTAKLVGEDGKQASVTFESAL